MKSARPPRPFGLALFSLGAALFLSLDARGGDFVAVSSTVSNGYARIVLPDGSFEPETYTFRNGGYLSGRMADATIDRMTFATVAHTIAGPLARRKYFSAVDPRAAKLLIVVYWGTTRAPAETTGSLPGPDQSIEAFADKMINEEDAMMLGYGSAADRDLQTYRYFVVLLAYDLQTFAREKKEKLLWQARFSMDEHRNQFDAQLGPMALEASEYFGQDSRGLRYGPVPEGHVEIGEVTSIGILPDPSGSAALASDGVNVAYLTKGEKGLELHIADVDRQEVHSTGPLPPSIGLAPRMSWFDPGRLLIRLPSSEVLAFDCNGRRVDFDPRRLDASFAGFARTTAVDASFVQVQAIAGEKLPDRKVVILESDRDRRRYLLIASDLAGVARFFVYDRPNDLMYDLGRGASNR
jgi:hypothetical protein